MHYNTHYFLHSHNSRSIHDFEVLFETEITIAHIYHSNQNGKIFIWLERSKL